MSASARVLNPYIHTIVTVLFLLASLSPLRAAQVVAADPANAPPDAGDLRAFQLVSPGSGWVLIGAGLYWTDSGGQQWRQLTPPVSGAIAMRAVSFPEPRFGWLVTSSPTQTGATAFQLIQTTNGGQSWQTAALALPDDVTNLAGEVFLQFLDPRTGWLVVKQDTSGLFSFGTLFRTTDGGRTWQRLGLPAGGPSGHNGPKISGGTGVWSVVA